MEKRASSLGGSSLLVMFAVLTLSVFAFLCLSTAQAERRLSDAAAEAVVAYYEADCQAEEIYARLRNGELPAEVEKDGENYRYGCEVSENQQLYTAFSCSEGKWKILRWQVVAQMPQICETLPVWDGNTH